MKKQFVRTFIATIALSAACSAASAKTEASEVFNCQTTNNKESFICSNCTIQFNHDGNLFINGRRNKNFEVDIFTLQGWDGIYTMTVWKKTSDRKYDAFGAIAIGTCQLLL